jgi:hypothetical protein
VLHTCSFLYCWAGLFAPGQQEDVAAGVQVMLSIAHKLFAQQKSILESGRLMAPNEDRPKEDEGA